MQIVRKGSAPNRIYGAIRFPKIVVKHHIRYCLFNTPMIKFTTDGCVLPIT